MAEDENPSGRSNLDTVIKIMETEGMEAATEWLNRRIETLMVPLSKEERQVLRDRFGLEDGRSRSFEEIAVARNLTPAQVEEIETAALIKFKGGPL